MTGIIDIMDISLLMQMIKEGYINDTHHPEFDDLSILNYSPECVYENVWNQATRMSRGLIINRVTEEVLARPFEKFWSAGQLEGRPELGTIPTGEPFRVFDKIDGSLGIGYRPTWDTIAVATRGSFASDQAIHATKILNDRYAEEFYALPRWLTPLFEIVYPDNRIVLDYGGLDDLVLLGYVDIRYGSFTPPWHGQGFPFTVAEYDHMEDDRPNKEGYVLWYPKSNFRVKVKHEEYLRLHAIVTMANTKTVWKAWSIGEQSLLVRDLPDEFAEPIKQLVAEYQAEFTRIEVAAKYDYAIVTNLPELEGIPHGGQRKEQAAWLKEHSTVSSIVFRMLDGKGYGEQICKMVEPKQAESIWN